MSVMHRYQLNRSSQRTVSARRDGYSLVFMLVRTTVVVVGMTWGWLSVPSKLGSRWVDSNNDW